MRRSIFIIALCLFYFCGISCSKAKLAPENIIPRIQIAATEMKMLAEEVSGFGALSFLTKVDITTSQDGIIRNLNYREGAMVPRGAIIAVLENPQIELAVGRAENAYSQAEAALRLSLARLMDGEFNAEAEILNIAKAEAELAQAERILEEQRRKSLDQERLFAAGGLSEESIRESRFSLSNSEEQFRLMERDLEIRSVGLRNADLRRAGLFPAGGFGAEDERLSALIRLSTSTLRAETEAAQAQLEASIKELESTRIARSELTIYSPVSGIVGVRHVEVGERAKREDRVITIIDSSALYVIFPLRESDALRLRPGMPARVFVDGAGGIFEGSVDLVSPQADSQSFTFSIRVFLPHEIVGPEETLKPGMFARATIKIADEKQVITAPDSAIVNRNNDEGMVFIINHGRVSQRMVRFGSLYDESREIHSGLEAGEIIALKPDSSLREGAHVIAEM